MDQLKLALEHKFWILAGLAILLPPIGWWAATDNLATETANRFKKIAEYEKKIPKADDVPNDKWIQGEKQIDGELTSELSQSWEHLYEHQKPEMTFPPIVQEALAKCKIRYRGEGSATEDFLAAKDFFTQKYLEDWKNAIDVIKPFKISTGEGLVRLPDDQSQTDSGITRHTEVEQWRQSLAFTGGQMWDVQEDVWFLRSLMKAIARVNTGTTEIGNSRIKKLNEATLRGGDLADLNARLSGKSGSGAAAGATRPQISGGTGVFSRGFGAGLRSESSYKAPKAFDADDVFGDDGSKSSATADPHDKKSGVPTVEIKRWVDSKQKWRKRGFVLRVVMDEREIPTLLTALSESAFPVEILHVEHSTFTAVAGSSQMAISNAPTANPDGSEFTKEQQLQQQKIAENLRMAFNMHYLADVIVAGTMTIYNEPPSTATGSAVATAAGSNRGSAEAIGSSATTRNSKAGVSGGGAAKSAFARPKSILNPPATKASSTKPASPVSPPPGAKSIPAGSGSRPTGK